MKQVLSVAAGILLALCMWSAPGWYKAWKFRRAVAREDAQRAALAAENERLRNLSRADVIAGCGMPPEHSDINMMSEFEYPDRRVAVGFDSEGKMSEVVVLQSPDSFVQSHLLTVWGHEEEIKMVLPCLLGKFR